MGRTGVGDARWAVEIPATPFVRACQAYRDVSSGGPIKIGQQQDQASQYSRARHSCTVGLEMMGRKAGKMEEFSSKNPETSHHHLVLILVEKIPQNHAEKEAQQEEQDQIWHK